MGHGGLAASAAVLMKEHEDAWPPHPLQLLAMLSAVCLGCAHGVLGAHLGGDAGHEDLRHPQKVQGYAGAQQMLNEDCGALPDLLQGPGLQGRDAPIGVLEQVAGGKRICKLSTASDKWDFGDSWFNQDLCDATEETIKKRAFQVIEDDIAATAASS